MAPTLNVYWNGDHVGTLASPDPGSLTFSYTKEWVQNKKPLISLSMPVRMESYQKEAQTFFGNLLPEGDFRLKIEQILKVSAANDFSLLKEIGGDCAGALSLGSTAEDTDEAYYETVSDDMLSRIVKTEGIAGLGQSGRLNRLSLAGAQGKLPVRFCKGEIQIPHNGAASTHILKFNRHSGEYPHLVENEYYMNRVAYHLGLNVVSCQLLKTAHGTILVIERYDRSRDEWPEKYHQEDFCQALAVSHLAKYEKEGGPSLADCVRLLRTHSGILDVNRIIDWYLFNLLMGNSDAHAKNISILLVHSKVWELAPFYDLVCTRAYERLDRKLAMACGKEFDPDQVSIDHMKTLAQETGITFRFLKSRIKQMLGNISAAMGKARQDFIDQGFEPQNIQNVEQSLHRIHRGFAKKFDSVNHT